MHVLAYINPGVGALIWQSIIGIFVGIVFYLRRTRQWVGRLMSKVLQRRQKPTPSEAGPSMSESKIKADRL